MRFGTVRFGTVRFGTVSFDGVEATRVSLSRPSRAPSPPLRRRIVAERLVRRRPSPSSTRARVARARARVRVGIWSWAHSASEPSGAPTRAETMRDRVARRRFGGCDFPCPRLRSGPRRTRWGSRRERRAGRTRPIRTRPAVRPRGRSPSRRWPRGHRRPRRRPIPARAGVVEVDGDVRAPAASAAVVVADVRAPSAPGPARVVRVVRLPRPAPPAARARARPLVRARLVRREEGAKHRVARERV